MYSLIIIATIGLLAFVIASNISAMLREQSINYNKQVLQTVNVYFTNQNKNFKKIMNNLYSEAWGRNTQLISHIQKLSGISPDNEEFSEKMDSTRVLNDFLSQIALPGDSDIQDAVIINPSFDFYVSESRSGINRLNEYYDTLSQCISETKVHNINTNKTYFIAPFKSRGSSSSMKVYAIYDYLRDSNDTSRYFGYLVATYNPSFIKNAYRQFTKYMIGEILILANDGSVIYDSSEKYYYEPFEYLEEINGHSADTFQNREYIIDVARNSEFGFMVVNMISKAELYKNINAFSRFILTTTVICILLIIALAFLTTRKFSKRINNIIGTLVEIQKGNLSARALTNGSNDEISQISNNLNLMTESLDEHIKKEYISELRRTNAELKQKTAELYALQSQINPHFLYNTLEAIRMRALSSGDKNVGEMIKILAKLFRSSIKDEMVVSVNDELNYSKIYLELYNIRFGDKLKVIYDIEPEILEFAVVKHLLQPIIENSIVHGINFNKENNIITVKGGISNDKIEITVSDNGQGIDEKALDTLVHELETPRTSYKGNIGLYNVNSRVKLIYGNGYGVKIRSKPGLGTEVKLTIIAMTREELLKNVQSADSR